MIKEMDPMVLWSQNVNSLSNIMDKLWEVNKFTYKNMENINEQIFSGLGKTIENVKNTRNTISNNQNNLGDQVNGMIEQFIQNQESQMKWFTSHSEQMMEQVQNNWEQAVGMATEMSKELNTNMSLMPGMAKYMSLYRQVEELSQKIGEQNSAVSSDSTSNINKDINNSKASKNQ